MIFSSLVFLYIFLPISLVGYYLVPSKFKNPFLFFSSLVFFAWGGVSYSAILIFSILFNYLIGLQISKRVNKRVWLGIGVFIDLLFLIVFKYANFIIDNLNGVLNIINIPAINNPSILLPVGISFYTFQAISYLMDVYRKTSEAQKNIINLGLYISLFPQLIAGPIVRYFDINNQIDRRDHRLDDFVEGLKRFVLGFAKKVLIANTMGYVADEIFMVQPQGLSGLLAWIGILAYTMQIYYDFSGYSDMAIGLARMFGFKLLENFNFPYVSKNIQEFWRRWHISLSNWFRDYLYIPLGGNRKGTKRTIINLFIVFFVTGFWHGASWNFLVWGLIHGIFLVLERKRFGKFISSLPSIFQSVYVLFVAVMTWVLFRADDLSYGLAFYKSMFSFSNVETDVFLLSKVLTKESVIVFTIAILGAYGGIKYLIDFIGNDFRTRFGVNAFLIAKSVFFALFMVFVILYGTGNLVLGSYNPFIYFRF